MSDLSWELSPKGVRFSLRKRKLFAKEAIPVADWTRSTSDRTLPGVALLLAWVDEEHAEEQSNSVLVHHARVASLDVVQAQSLSLPSVAPFVLDIQHQGTFDTENFSFRLSWLQPNGQPIPGLRRIGSILETGSGAFRVAEPMYSISEGVETFNAVPETDIDGRFRAWAQIKTLFPEETGRSVSVGGYLASTRIAHASSFSLALKSGVEGFNFDPVLFGDHCRPGAPGNDNTWVHESEGLLPPAQQALFSSRRFKESSECKARYALGAGWYVVLDEPVRLALSVVRRAQDADKETRKSFVQNPRAFLQRALGSTLSAEVLEKLFIETAEYSDRVKDVGIWQSKVLPWVKRANDSWFPEKFGIRIDGENIEIDPADLSAIVKQVEEAIDEGRETLKWQEKEIPANAGSLAALKALVGEAEPLAEERKFGFSDEKAADLHPSGAQYVLEIEDNLSELAYERLKCKRDSQLKPSIPVSVATALKAHQQEGLRWLQEAFISGHPGVLLADDMGLGKTLQALSFLAWLREAMELGRLREEPILIVAPTGLLRNWEQEHSQHLHAPGLGSLLRAYGSGIAQLRSSETKGQDTRIGAATLDTGRIGAADWILTTYETLRDYQHSFCALRYSTVVFDEMQKIKTPGTVMAHAAKALNAEFILGLTGTPVENRLADLWCLVDTLQPGLLKDLSSFSRTYEKDETPEQLRALKAMLTEGQMGAPAIMMRRMKADRLQGLPEKIEHSLPVNMPPEQSEAYERAVTVARTRGGGSKILEALHQLRSISLHPYHPSQAKDDSYASHSARVRMALDVLDEIATKGEKALIFLESQEFQPYLAGLIQRRYKTKQLPMLINGAVSGPKRQERVNLFQQSGKGFDVIILSPRAGGVGLTLTAANHVIHLSRWWNPAVEDQCTDRVYRIGQEKAVHVYYPQAVHPIFADQSFDLRLHRLLENKRALSRDLLMPPVNPEDATTLFNETVVGDSETSFDLSSIDSMEPIQFEDWVLHRLVEAGHQVNKTKKSGDCGADGIVFHRLTKRAYIIQCKHTQSASSPDAAINDLLKAKEAYMVTDPKLVAITNAKSFGAAAKEHARQHDMLLVDRASLPQWPHVID